MKPPLIIAFNDNERVHPLGERVDYTTPDWDLWKSHKTSAICKAVAGRIEQAIKGKPYYFFVNKLSS